VSDLTPLPARWIKVGILAFPLLAIGLWVWSPLGFWGCAYLAALLAILPVLGYAQMAMAEDDQTLPRVPVYLTSCATILVLGWLGYWVGIKEVGRGFMGLGVGALGPFLLWTFLVAVSLHALLLLFFFGRRRLGIRESALLHRLLPETPSEKLLFGLLSLAAGMGEELAYRGFAIPALTVVTGSEWTGALLSSVAFGFLHGYQGWLGILRTGIMGFILAGSFILSGSLWPAIVAHALLDLVSGLLLGRTLLESG
jgi:membrane protease YdiL (CAAX protease family)